MRNCKSSYPDITFAPSSIRLHPSGPTIDRVNRTIACATTFCGNRNSNPADCVNQAPAKKMELSRSFGTPSS